MICGIDVGLNGGLAFLNKHGRNDGCVPCSPMPVNGNEVSCREVRDLFLAFGVTSVFIEHSQAIPKAAAGSVFKFGAGFGMIIGVVAALDLPYTLVKPKAWQKVMHQGIDPSLDPKRRSLLAAERLFPTQTFLKSERSSKPHDGMIDAALIAEYGRRIS